MKLKKPYLEIVDNSIKIHMKDNSCSSYSLEYYNFYAESKFYSNKRCTVSIIRKQDNKTLRELPKIKYNNPRIF